MSGARWVKLALDAEHPRLLDGLEALLHMGLISDEFVRLVGRSQLSCETPDYRVIAETVKSAAIALPEPEPEEPAVPGLWERFLAELSVRWLLFLGVFLVVLSSGVLVASQWANFPAVGQYLVLWSYTVIFGLVGFWASGQPELHLTSRTLQTVAMLLVPLNFWAVDQLEVWRSPLQGVVAMAAIAVLVFGVERYRQGQTWSKPMVAGFFILGLCHWGWEMLLAPVMAVYLGIGVIIAILWGLPLVAKRAHPQKIPENSGLEFLLFGLGLLLFRAIAIAEIPIGELGLGVGALGWLLTELEQRKIDQNIAPTSTEAIAQPWEVGGAVLLLLGWLVTVGRYEWQVLGVSALAVVWLLQKLCRHWLVADLVALFVVGLQGGILCREVIPTGVKQTVTTTAIDFSQAYDFPYSIYSVALLPYLIIWAIVAVWLYRYQKYQLAKTSEYLLLSLGIILAGLSITNPTWRAINFTISAGIWFYFTEYSRPYLRRSYLYLCHGMMLLAIGGIIERFSPDLTLLTWGNLCLLGIFLEWVFCLFTITHRHRKIWQLSSWHYGIILAIASLTMLLLAPLPTESLSRLAWLMVPCMATAIAYRQKRKWRWQAITVSVLSLALLPISNSLIVQLNQINIGAWIERENWLFLQISLAIAVGLMGLNIRLIPTLIFSHLHLGFSTALIISLIAQKITDWQWLIITTVASGTVWSVAYLFRGRQRYLKRLYRKTCHQWGLIFAFLVTFFLAEYSLNQIESISYLRSTDLHLEIVISSSLLILILLSYFWHKPKNEALLMGAIAVESGLMEGILLWGKSPLIIALINFIIATFLIIIKAPDKLKKLSIWQAYPLMFTLLGWWWRVGYFNAYTGLLILYAGILFLAIAHRYPTNQFIRFLGFASISLGIYESTIYQMSQSSGNNIGDALTILALVGIIIALIYRSLHWLFTRQHQTKIAAIPLPEILTTAHLHWLLAAILKLLTLPYFLNEPPSLKILAIAVNIGLAIYAFIQAQTQGVEPVSKRSDWWIYVGAIELITTGIQARWLWSQLTVIDPFRVFFVSILALIIFQLPWSNLGWQTPPWHRVGIAMPALCLAMTATDEVSYLSLASITFVYIRLAQIQHNLRWSYISLIFGNWLISKILFAFALIQPLTYSLQIGLSILFIAQFDPELKAKNQRYQRHYWRIIGSGIICAIALIHYQQFGLTPAIISLSLIFLAIATQIRAFLYNGTITLILTGIYQLVILIEAHSFAKWVIGLIAGIVLISIAANFEQRRLQILTVIENWLEELSHWQ